MIIIMGVIFMEKVCVWGGGVRDNWVVKIFGVGVIRYSDIMMMIIILKNIMFTHMV